jgi:hypothetical protein
MSVLVRAFILSLSMGMSVPALTPCLAQQPTAGLRTTAAEPQSQATDERPWIDLSLTGQALNAAMRKAHVTVMAYSDDHSVFTFFRPGKEAKFYTSAGDASGDVLHVSGPAAVQLGNANAVKVYSIGANRQAICVAAANYQNCFTWPVPVPHTFTPGPPRQLI